MLELDLGAGTGPFKHSKAVILARLKDYKRIESPGLIYVLQEKKLYISLRG
jgi:hypothetical protein